MMQIIVLHPYYKLAYIKLAWGGEEEQAKEQVAGNRYAKNWQDKARKVIEVEVQYIILFSFYRLTSFTWKNIGGIAPKSMPTTTWNTPTADDMDDGTTTTPVMSNFHQYC